MAPVVMLSPVFMVRVREPDAAVRTKKLRVVTLTIGCEGALPALGAGAKSPGLLFTVFAPACRMFLLPARDDKAVRLDRTSYMDLRFGAASS